MKLVPNGVRPRWHKVLSDLWSYKGRSLLVVASIAVGVFALGATVTAYVILAEDLNVSYASVNPANIEMWTDPFDDGFLRSVLKVSGVADAEGRHIQGVRASQDGESWQTLDLVAIKDFGKSNTNLLNPLEGASSPGKRELLIGWDALNGTGFQVGDLLEVQVSDGTVYRMPVVGIVRDQVSRGSDFISSPFGYITMGDLEWLGQSESYNRLYARVSGDSDDENVIRTVSDAIENKIEKSGRRVYRTRIDRSSEHPLGSLALALLGILGAMGALTLLLSCSLVVNTLNALLAQHLRQIGVMKLVGARSYQILGMYVVLILSLGLIALAIAAPLGALAGYGLAAFPAYFFNTTLQGFRIIPAGVLLQAVIALVVPLLAGFGPVNSGSRIKVREAISYDRPGNQPSGGGWLVRAADSVRWLSRPMLLSLRNTFRRKRRLLLTLVTLTIAGAMFIAVFNVRASLGRFVDQLTRHFVADVTVNFEQPYRISKVEQVSLQVPGIHKVEAWSATGAAILNADDSVANNLHILAPPAESSLIDPDIVAGRWIKPGERKALAVSDSIRSVFPSLQPGDTLRLRIQGQRDEDWVVVGIFRFTNPQGGILGYADYAYVSELLGMTNQAFSFRLVTDEHDMEYQKHISLVLNGHLAAQGFRVRSVEPGLVTAGQASKMIDVLIVFLLLMALLTALVGSIGLAGTMGMNVLERTREIGILRAIGAVDATIIKSVVTEGVLIGLISWLLGTLLSAPISYLLLAIVSRAMVNAPVPLVFTAQGLVIWLIGVVILSALASALPARNASRLTIREVLAYE